MRTSYFAKQRYTNRDMNLVAICLRKPKWFNCKHYTKLAPTQECLSEYNRLGNKDVFVKRYTEEVLDKLDPHEVYKELGEDAILLCYERSSDFCHRHLIAAWLVKAGYDVSEIMYKPKRTKPINTIIEVAEGITDIKLIEEAVALSGFNIKCVVIGVTDGIQLAERYANENDLPIRKVTTTIGKHGKLADFTGDKDLVHSAAALLAIYDDKSEKTKSIIMAADMEGLKSYIHTIPYPYGKQKSSGLRTIIAGSRSIDDPILLREAIDHSGFQIKSVVSGTARGVDRLGEAYARDNDLPLKQFPANWDTFGKSAGYRRNAEMADYADALICVWDGVSKGSQHMVDLAKKKGLNVYVHTMPF